MPNCATILIDMEERFFEDSGYVPKDYLEEIENQKKVLNYSLEKGFHVYFVNNGTNFIKEFEEYEKRAETIEKESNSVFSNKDFKNILDRNSINTLIFMGLNGSCCVWSSISDAEKFGCYNIIVPKGTLIDTVSQSDFEVTLEEIRKRGYLKSLKECLI